MEKPQSKRMIEFSFATIEAGRGGHPNIKVIRGNYQPRILRPEKDGQIKTFQINKTEFASNRLSLKGTLL